VGHFPISGGHHEGVMLRAPTWRAAALAKPQMYQNPRDAPGVDGGESGDINHSFKEYTFKDRLLLRHTCRQIFGTVTVIKGSDFG